MVSVVSMPVCYLSVDVRHLVDVTYVGYNGWIIGFRLDADPLRVDYKLS